MNNPTGISEECEVESKMSEVKKDVWSIDVRRESVLKVVFAEAVTATDALRLFDMEEYEDVIDEEDHGTEALRAE